MRILIKNNIKINILKGPISYYLLFAIILSPPYLQFFSLLNDVINVLRVVFFIVLFYDFITSRKMEKIAIVVVCWQIIYLFSALINSQLSMSFWFYFINRIGAVLFTIEGVKKDTRRFLLSGRNYLLIFLCISLFQVIFKLGHVTEMGMFYLFGLRIGISIYVILALLFSLLYDYYDSEGRIKVRKTTIFIMLMGVSSLFFLKVATGLIGVIIMFLMYCLLSHNILKKRRILFLIPVFLFAMIVILGIKLNFLGYILNVFDKDLTFTGRTRIWSQALNYISEKPFLGHGTNVMPIDWVYSTIMQPAHNEILNDIYSAGIFVLPFIIYSMIGFINSSIDSFLNDLYFSVIFGISLMMLTEIQSDYSCFFIIISLGYMIYKYPELMKGDIDST